MSSVFVVIANIFGKQPFQVSLVRRDHVVKQIAPAALNPPLRDPVLPRAFERSPNGSDAHGSEGYGKFKSVFGIAVENQESWSMLKRERFPQLLNDPRTRGMASDI